MNHPPFPTNTRNHQKTSLPDVVGRFMTSLDRRLDPINHTPRYNAISHMVFLGSASVLIAWNLFLGFVMVSTLNMNDFGKFYYSIAAYLDGQNMYGPNPATRMEISPGFYMQLWNLNPPHFHVILYPLGYLSPHTALGIWVGINFIAGLISFIIIAKNHPANPTSRHRKLIFLLLLAFSGTNILFVTGQLVLLLLLPLTLFWIESRKGNWRRGGIFLGLVCSIKPFLLIFVPYFFLKRQYAALVNFFIVIVSCYLVGYLIFGNQAHVQWIEGLMSINWYWTNLNGSIFGFLSRTLSQNPLFAPVIHASGLITPLWLLLGGIITIFTYWVIYFDTTEQSVDRALMLLFLSAILISPAGWQYYVFFSMGPICILVYLWRMDQESVISSKGRVLKIGRTIFLYMAIPGLLFPFLAIHLLQPNRFATITLGSVYFWSIVCLWTSGILDGFLEKVRTKYSPYELQRKTAN